MKKSIEKITLLENRIQPGTKYNTVIFNMGSQPPIKNITVKQHIKIILEYSAREKRANVIDEYSTLYPGTSSDSASGESNGVRFVSASIQIKNRKKDGNSGKQKYIFFWANTIPVRFAVFDNNKTGIIIKPMETS